jgi:hypothetical protein
VEEKIKINDTEYDYAELEDNQQYYVNQVRSLKARIAEEKFNLDQLAVAEDTFTKMLVASLEQESDTEKT